nr:hypothetical protein Iba_chr07aCG10640 [Ipomoea batatas]GMD14952.1 hypothetical protein Iba_chr07bCG11390 [Ipomoea batatas]GMD16528.1 hypothetical protein Iba_chr07cCG10280 [Ipomoea batatas]GME09970.1 hypothetical protein Iba_scaffold9247CG0010 [Ipomoea batatas]
MRQLQVPGQRVLQPVILHHCALHIYSVNHQDFLYLPQANQSISVMELYLFEASNTSHHDFCLKFC